MPVKQSKDGHRRSGQGVAVPTLGKPIVKNFDPPRRPWLSGAGGSPSASVDTTWNQTTQQQVTGIETSELPGMCGCTSSHVCRCPKSGIILDEIALRQYIRNHILIEFDASKAVHVGLDLCGLIAGPGEVCDLGNALIYAAKGEWLNAGFSLISVIPELGDIIGKGGKLTVWLAKNMPRTASMAKKYGPTVSKYIRMIREAIRAHKEDIDKIMEKLAEHEKLAGYIPHIQEALDAFANEREISRIARDVEEFMDDMVGDIKLTIESEVIDEDDDDLDEESAIDEFSGVASLGGGPQLPLGMSTPTFGRKRKKKGKEVPGFKLTHA